MFSTGNCDSAAVAALITQHRTSNEEFSITLQRTSPLSPTSAPNALLNLSTPPPPPPLNLEIIDKASSADNFRVAPSTHHKSSATGHSDSTLLSAMKPPAATRSANGKSVDRTSIRPAAQASVEKDCSLLASLKLLFISIHNQGKKSGAVSPRDFIKIIRDDNGNQFTSTHSFPTPCLFLASFRSPTHHDAHEFLNYLLNSIGDSLIRQRQQLDLLMKEQQIATTPISSQPHRPLDGINNSAANSDPRSPSPYSPSSQNPPSSPPFQTWIHELFEGILTNQTRCLNCETVLLHAHSYFILIL